MTGARSLDAFTNSYSKVHKKTSAPEIYNIHTIDDFKNLSLA